MTRNWLKTMGLTDEQVNAIMEEHTKTTDGLKAKLQKAEDDAKAYKEEADKIPELEKQIKDSGDLKAKYDKEHQDFEDYKAKIAKDEQTAKVKAAYRKLLLDEKINEKRVDAVIKLTDFSEMKLDKDGNLENLDTLKKTIGDEWGEYKVTTQQRKQQVATPPGNDQSNGFGRARELYLNRLKQQGIKVEDAGKE